MADIELVIKIPEEDWEFIKEADGCRCSRAILDGVINGTSLPKGHGRLIDADKLLNSFELSDFNGDEYDCINTACRIVNSMPTIIEADKEQ